jgi:hypothetical protein
LRKRPVSHVDLDRHERNATILHDNDLEAVRQNLPLNASFQLGTLRRQPRGQADREQRGYR